jgi:prepilin-type N-terminal cleavage/methylation domain-containing protein
MKNKKLKGFTLIELLVVITIIGILATIVVVNLNSTRGRGQDVAVKEQMSQIRAASELYYDGQKPSGESRYGYSDSGTNGTTDNCKTTGTWTGTYFADADFQKSIDGIVRNSGNPTVCSLGQGTINNQSWRVVADLRLGNFWCVDSYGTSKELSTQPAAVSGAVDAKCP